MRVVHVIAGLWTETGGPGESVPGLCRALAQAGHEVTLVTGAGPLTEAVLALASVANVQTVRLGPYRVANASLAFATAMRAAAATAHVVHSHGLWLHPNWAAAAAARRQRLPLVISPRGMLQPAALQRSRWRKLVLLRLMDGRHLKRAKVIHATSEAEAAAVRALGFGTPVATVPNGVDLSRFPIEQVRQANTQRVATGRVVFLGRIHPIKGLATLFAAWPRVRAVHPDSVLTIAGPGETIHLEAFQRMAAGLAGVEWRGGARIGPDERLGLLGSASVVVLPSQSENYGMVVAEALACRTPVVTTTNTPWRSLADERCSWWVPLKPDAIASAIIEALSLREEERMALGLRGRELIEREHSLQAVAGKVATIYEWAAGCAPPPPFVSLRGSEGVLSCKRR